ncbi:caspase, EACC1-associated type, partial [Streptomyces sp. NPDC059900]
MARLPDPEDSRAVLIGCSRYTELEDIPAIRNNLSDLGQIIAGSDGFRPEGVNVIADPRHASDVGPRLREVSEQASDVLLVYYAGHGLIDAERGQLHLALSETRVGDPATTGLPFAHIQSILRRSPARFIVLIVDCSYAGAALGGLGGESGGLGGLGDSVSGGVFVLTATAATGHAIARTGEPYSAFTGELIRLLKQGIAGPYEYLTPGAVAAELRRTMTSLTLPLPQSMEANAAGSLLGLVRNPAYDPAARPDTAQPPSADGTATASPPAPASGSTAVDLDVDDVEWVHDTPATADLLGRAPVAKVLGLRLTETQMTEPGTSFLVHLDGPWGSGKSSLLNLVEQQVDDHFLVVRFDAWQQSRLAPSWWSLLTCLRRDVAQTRARWRRPFLRLRESAARARRTGAPYATAFVVVALLAAVLGYLLWPHKPGLAGWEQQLKAGTAILAALATLTTGALLAARLLLWDSVRGARLFEQTQANPLADIAAHFRWLLRRADKPVVFFVDDLDRCDQAYVVEFLDMVQTLVRTQRSPGRQGTERAAHFVVAADGSWLRRSYETAHEQFVDSITEPGRPLGYLFLDKLFQLCLPMPTLSGPARSAYLDHLLRVTDSRQQEGGSPPDIRSASPGLWAEGDVMERLRQFEEGRAQSVYEAMQRLTERRRAEHTLRKFRSVLGDNPRAAKKFLNTY